MLTTRLNIRRAARYLRRGGFTLVELLVVIGIIAILAGVALGPITNGIKKAKQSSGVTAAHSIGLAMYSYSNDNSQSYPDKSGGGGTADDVAAALMAGSYVTDPSIFVLSADKNGATPLSTSNNTASTIAGSGVTCWDFLGGGGTGASSTTYTWLPLLWNAIGTGTQPTLTTTAAAITAVPGQTSAFSTDGLAIFYVNNSAAFVTSTLSGSTPTVTMVSAAANQSATAPTGYTTLKGK